jgi:UDP-3-O-[3-hydroxymyristoyl] glucosamine N-acyltransferase
MRDKSITLQELASLTNATLQGNPEKKVTGVADLEKAQSFHVSFLSNSRYAPLMKHTQAGAVFVSEQMPSDPSRNYLVVKNPSESFQKAIEFFAVPATLTDSYSERIHPTAIIHSSAVLEENVFIGPYVVIEKNVRIGRGTHLLASIFVGADTVIGEDCLFYPQVTIREGCRIGNRVILQPGVVLGACGFGYATDKNGVHTKLAQLGNVEIEDDVEIGANATIDRGRFQSTKVGKGTKIDNLVMLGHGVEIGPHNLIIAQSGVAGSTKTGSHCVLAAQVGVAGHLELDDGVVVAAKSGVHKDLKKGTYSGIPVQELQQNHRMVIHQRKLAEYAKRLSDLEKRLEELPS